MNDAPSTRPGWLTIGAYAMVCAATQLLWLTYAPITTLSAHHYGVSESAIGWLSEIFPLLYVVLAIPAGRVLDRSLEGGLRWGAALTALGGVLRLVGDRFIWALLGQIVVSIAQPLVLNAVTKLASERLPAERRADGIALGSVGVFGGMLAALLLGATLGGSNLSLLLVVNAIFGVLAAVAMFVVLQKPAIRFYTAPQGISRGVREVWADPGIRVLVGLVAIGFGTFIALTTWLQALLAHYNVSSDTAGGLLVVMVVAGAIGAAVLAPLVARRGAESTLVSASILAAAIGCLLLAFVHVIVIDGLALGVMGLLLLTDLPVILELCERRAGADGGTATALLWLAGNGGGLVVALIVQIIIHHPHAAFVTMALVPLFALPLAQRLRNVGVPQGVLA